MSEQTEPMDPTLWPTLPVWSDDPALWTEADRIGMAKAIADWKTGRGHMPALTALRAAVASIRTARRVFVDQISEKPDKPARQGRAQSPPPKAGVTPVSFDDMGF